MRVAAIYDIHSNLPALEAVLDEVRDIHVDCVVVGGDVVPGPMPRETLSVLRSLSVPTHFLQGNGERDTVAMFTGSGIAEVPEQAREVIQWTVQALSPEDLDFLQSWPQIVRLKVPGVGDVLFCHATPRSDREIFTAKTPEERLVPLFETVKAAVVVCGHTHMQFDRMVGKVRVLNAGSVGMPFGNPGAYWLVIDSDVELRCTKYDTLAAAERLAATDYPGAIEFAKANVQIPPQASTMLELFERAALR